MTFRTFNPSCLNRNAALAAIFQLSLTSASWSQQQPAPVYLSNYTFTAQQPQVGTVHTADGAKIRSVKILGPHAAIIRADRQHRISVVPARINDTTACLDAVVQVRTANGSYTDTFRLVRDQFIRNRVIAHRGAFKNTGVAENSVAALQHAVALGCAGSEFDVHQSADGVPFINHDPKIQEHVIAETPASVLSAIKLAHGEALPTLEAYLRAGSNQNKTRLVLEIKVSSRGKDASIALTQKVVAMVQHLNAEAWVDYISFDYDVCKEVMRLAPYAKVAYLNGDKAPEALAAERFYGLDYHFSVLQKNKSWIADAHKHNLTVNVWTVNDKAMMQDLLGQGADFITTNEPELLLQLVSAKETAGNLR